MADPGPHAFDHWLWPLLALAEGACSEGLSFLLLGWPAIKDACGGSTIESASLSYCISRIATRGISGTKGPSDPAAFKPSSLWLKVPQSRLWSRFHPRQRKPPSPVFGLRVLEDQVLGGSGVVIRGFIRPLMWVISIVTLHITLLIVTHEPPSLGLQLKVWPKPGTGSIEGYSG